MADGELHAGIQIGHGLIQLRKVEVRVVAEAVRLPGSSTAFVVEGRFKISCCFPKGTVPSFL
jgi:hypothetical protein